MITQKRLANFYHQLATLINSGVGIIQALKSLETSTSHFSFKKIIRGVMSLIREGSTLAEAMRFYPGVFSSLQIRIVEIGEKTGKLPESMARIADILDRNHSNQMKLITGLLYPAFLLHAAILIPAIPQWFTSGFGAFLKIVLPALGCFYGVLLFILVIVRISNRIHILKSFFQYFLNYIPVVGSLIKKLAIARFMWNLSALYNAGEDIARSIRLACEGCGNIPLESSFLKTLPDIEKGESITLLFKKTRAFPGMVIEMLNAGEESGKIGDMLDRVAQYYEEETETTIKRIVIILPVLIYLAVAMYIAGIIIRFYVGYFGQIDALFQ
jgi:type IV pilus assembly protein PilC